MTIELTNLEDVSRELWKEISCVYNKNPMKAVYCSCCTYQARTVPFFLVLLKNDQNFTRLSKTCLAKVVAAMENNDLHRLNAEIYKNLNSCYRLLTCSLIRQKKTHENYVDTKCNANLTFLITIKKITGVDANFYKNIRKTSRMRTASDILHLRRINSIIFNTFCLGENTPSVPFSASSNHSAEPVNINIEKLTINVFFNGPQGVPNFKFEWNPRNQDPRYILPSNIHPQTILNNQWWNTLVQNPQHSRGMTNHDVTLYQVNSLSQNL